MREGRDYFKTNAIREKCTVGKSSWRAPFILTLRAEERRGRRVATSVSMTEEELCSRRQRKGRRGGRRTRGQGRHGGVRVRRRR